MPETTKPRFQPPPQKNRQQRQNKNTDNEMLAAPAGTTPTGAIPGRTQVKEQNETKQYRHANKNTPAKKHLGTSRHNTSKNNDGKKQHRTEPNKTYKKSRHLPRKTKTTKATAAATRTIPERPLHLRTKETPTKKYHHHHHHHHQQQQQQQASARI